MDFNSLSYKKGIISCQKKGSLKVCQFKIQGPSKSLMSVLVRQMFDKMFILGPGKIRHFDEDVWGYLG